MKPVRSKPEFFRRVYRFSYLADDQVCSEVLDAQVRDQVEEHTGFLILGPASTQWRRLSAFHRAQQEINR